MPLRPRFSASAGTGAGARPPLKVEAGPPPPPRTTTRGERNHALHAATPRLQDIQARRNDSVDRACLRWCALSLWIDDPTETVRPTSHSPEAIGGGLQIARAAH
jgi:hypothetical protein